MPQRENPLLERVDAIVVSLEQDTKEIEELARSMNYSVKRVFVQKRQTPDSKFFIGTGKIDEIKGYLTSPDGKSIKVAAFNAPLKPTQIFHIQNALGLTVFDRTRLILEIFSNRAQSQEARLQVELAKLEYEVPFVKELIHRSKMGEHPGYMAGGEYPVNTYFDMITKRIKRIKGQLKTMKKDRQERRKHRRDAGFFLISIAGYTNAGKSQLLKALTTEDVIIENRFFSTLFTITRRGEGKAGGAFLFSDTVGFIHDLPPWLIEAFNSTLEEIYLSDLVLLVVDISENEYECIAKIVTSYSFLQFEDSVPSIVLVFNKMDLVKESSELDRRMNRVLAGIKEHNIPILTNCVISAKDMVNMDSLMTGIISSISKLDYIQHLKLSFNKQQNLSNLSNVDILRNWLFGNNIILSSDENDEAISFDILTKRSNISLIDHKIETLGLIRIL